MCYIVILFLGIRGSNNCKFRAKYIYFENGWYGDYEKTVICFILQKDEVYDVHVCYDFYSGGYQYAVELDQGVCQ